MCKLKTVSIFSGFFIVLTIVEVSVANSLVDPYICGQPSCTPSGKFNYQTEIIYRYDYNVSVNTWFEGSSDNKSTLNIGAKIQLEFITQCEGLLKIQTAKMTDQETEYPQEREETLAHELAAYPLRFAFHDGVITEICPLEGEVDWTLNFKRGALSLFQNTMGRFDIDHKGIERDIHGTCDTEYKMQGQQNTSLIVMKIKDLSQCQDRYKYLSILQTVRYNFQSKFQTWPVLQSESRCRISIDHKVYTDVACKERHLFEPFSGKRSGALSTVTLNLKLSEEVNKSSSEILDEKKEEWEAIKLRYSLLHHHSASARPGTGELKSARNILKQLCKVEEAISDMESEERPEMHIRGPEGIRVPAEDLESGQAVSLWGGLVRACRGLHHPALAQLLSRATTICPQARKHVLDALPYIASVGSVELIKEMIIGGTATEETRLEWLMSMATIPRPQLEMIASMKELLEHSPTDKAISLAASSMVHSYCRNSKHSLIECCMEEQNMAIIKIFQNNVIEILDGGAGNISKSLRGKVSISIKSLGNIGGFTKDFAAILMGVIENENIRLPVRIHSVDAFRKTPCYETRSYFLELFRKQSLDVEIRLAAYLQVMRCPSYVTVRKILGILKEEKINQVASFVWSHLTNLGKSTIPSRVEKQGLLSGNTIPRPTHQPDFRKFSRNYEHGVFFDQYNAGGNYEANIIMSPDSYIPRSASVNLTLDMFGESINILELNLRGEGFEKYIENIFGDNGLLSRSKIDEKLSSFTRFLRSPSEADTLREKIDSIDYDNEALKHREPLLDLGMKVFGNEINYWSAEGDAEIMDSITKLNPLYHVKNILSGKEISYKKASMFLDTTYSVPTGCGLPMTMNLMGTSVVNLKMSGSISGTDKFFETHNLTFEGKMHPSMAVNIAATMSINAGGLGATGIRVNMRLHTATALSANVMVREGRSAGLKLSLPHTKQEIFEAKSELIVLHGSKEMKQVGINKDRVKASTCSWKTLDYAIGIKMCATYEFPNLTSVEDAPYFIMAGPANYLLSLEKVDPSANVYSFLYAIDFNETATNIGFSFDTPGSKTKRMFNASISSLSDSGTAILAYQSSNHYLRAHATYQNHLDHKFVECVLDIDGQKHFDAVMSLDRQEQKNGYVLIPKLYVAVNDERITELAGTLRMAQKKGVSQCDVSLQFQTKRLASRLIGYLTWNGPSKGAKLRLDYQFLGERKETIKIDALVSNRELGQRLDFYGELGLDFTSYPHLNFFTASKYTGTPHHVECNMNLSSSREMMSENSRIQFAFARHRTFDGFKLQHHLKLKKPYLDIFFIYEEDGSLSTVNTTVLYDKTSNAGGYVGVSGRLYMPPGLLLYLEAGLNATLPSLTPMVVQLKLHEKSSNQFDISAQGVWFTGTDASVMALYQELSTPHLASRRLKAVVSGSTFREIAVDAKYTQDNRQLNFNLRGEQDSNNYSLMGRYILYSEKNFTCYGQLDITSKSYSVSLAADLFNDSSILADIHLDQLRDIHITYSKINRPQVKKLNADINWDANRDPNQKVSVAMELMNKGLFNFGGSFLLFYPGRLINGEFDFLFQDWLIQWLVKLGWSPDDNIHWKVKIYSEMERETVYALLSDMDTPFNGWRDTSLNLVWRYVDNMQSIGGNMTWEKERFVFGLKGNYMLKTNEAFGEINALMNSSLTALPNVAAIAKHHHVWRKSADTFLSFEYNEDGLMMLNSSWNIDKSATSHNISGRVGMKSPFQGYRTGLLVTKFMFNQKRDVQGLTHIDLEEKVYTITVDGHIHRITNSMLVFNVTTPTPIMTLMSGRIGFVDTNRHLVAMLETPNMTAGVELLLRVNSMKDFHVFSHVALPIEFLQDTLVLAKRSKEEVDFRLGWDKHILGFTGIWHYNSGADFQYLYKLFTPLHGFEENGLVFKNIYKGGLDSEVSIRLSKLKLGVAILIRDNGVGLLKIIEEKYLGIKKKGRDQIVEDFSTDVFAEVDTLYFPTITFDTQLRKVEGPNQEEIFKILATLNLPNNSAIILKDKFVMLDYTTMTHELNLQTPFSQFREINLYQTVEIILDEKYNVTLRLFHTNGTDWTENSIRAFYEYEVGEDTEFSSRTASINVISQLEALKFLNAKLIIQIDESLSRVAANVDLPSCQLDAKGQIEMDETFMDATGSMNLTSMYIQPYDIRLEFKKDFSDVENTLVCGLQVKQGNQNNFLLSELSWRTSLMKNLRAKVQVSLIPVIPPSELTLAMTNEETYSVLKTEARIGSRDTLYTLAAERKKGHTVVVISSPHRGFRNLNLAFEIKNNETVVGTLVTDSNKYNVAGKIAGKNPMELVATLKPAGDGETYTVRIKTLDIDNKYSLSASLIGALQFTLHINFQNSKNVRDFSAKIDSSNEHIKEMFIKARTEKTDDNRVILSISSITPFKNLKTLNANADISLSPRNGSLICNYNLTQLVGESNVRWHYIPGDDLFFKVKNYHTINGVKRSVDVDTFYLHNATKLQPKVLYENYVIGFHIDIDNGWSCGTNTSLLTVGNSNKNFVLNVLLPKPNEDVHTLDVGYSNGKQGLNTVEVKYSTDVNQFAASATGKLLLPKDKVLTNLTLDWGAGKNVHTIDNILQVEMVKDTIGIAYTLVSPAHKDQETFKLKGTFNKPTEELTSVIGTVCYPASNQILDMDLTYGGLKHTVGTVNVTTWFKNIPWIATDARIANGDTLCENMIQLFWPNQSALLNATHKIEKNSEKSLGQFGIISLELPLNTRHILVTDYSYVQGDMWSHGKNTLFYNGDQMVEGLFKSTSDIGERDLLRDTVDISVDVDKFSPFGIHYIHQYDDKHTDIKQASLYELNNATNFNLTGRLDIEPWNSGKQVKVLAIQGNRTIRFENNYESKEKQLFQGSKLQWAPDVWLYYDVSILNKTETENESQELQVNVKYPQRTFSLISDYHLKETLLEGSANLNWSLYDDIRTVRVEGRWFNPDLNDSSLHDIKLSLMHPSFSKDVTFLGKYTSDAAMTSNVAFTLDYSDYENDQLTFNSMLRDNSNGPIRDYRFELDCKHPATNLDLIVKTDLNMNYKFYRIFNYYSYQKSLFYQIVRQGLIFVDLQNHSINYERINEKDWYKMNTSWINASPEYKIYVKVNRTTGKDDGVWILSTKEKSILAHFNRSDDISYHLIGQVNDARSADLGAWRDFDNIKTIDISSYIRLNHSRLLTSQILWRPEIYQEVKTSVSMALKNIYTQTNEVLQIWKGVPIETLDVLKNVWTDAKPKLRDFLNDLNDLHVIKEDWDEFQKFLEQSYELNEFYTKDIAEFLLNIFDQLSLRNHIESLPKIVNEMWHVMGDTGKSLRVSIQWIIDTIKASYAQMMEKINSFLEADIMDQVSNLMEAGILKYDSFVKNLHLKFIHYVEAAWIKTMNRLSVFWKGLLKSMEPTFLKVIHYAESFVWKFGKEVLDFFYARTNELTESPYFSMLSNMTQDVDKFWKDMTNNDAVTNIKKYTAIIIAFVNDKIMVHIPFQKELKEIASEIFNELNRLQELKIVQFVKAKFWEAKSRLQWWYNYFKIGEALDVIALTLYEKITEVSKTALQNEEAHRSAKTNFIFDPRKGQMLLEQKLPVPWHAFNRTPDFSELTEYKIIHDLLDTWLLSNITLMSYYYEFKPYTDIYNLLPPFAGTAVITGYGTVVTMDRHVFTMTEPGTFLLATDFLYRNITILAQSDTPNKYNLVLLSKKALINIDLFNESVTVGGSGILTLPDKVDDWILERDEEQITIENVQGVAITCSYHFKTCVVKVQGWYFARLGGLFGTMNNEPSDDILTPEGKIPASTAGLTKSWRLIDGGFVNPGVESLAANETVCEPYFKSKVSPLKACFPMINVSPFYDECMTGLDPCVLANIYKEICLADHIPIRTPEKCMECVSPTGEPIDEGTFNFVVDVPNSTDVVFIVETHSCNNNIRKSKNLDVLLSILNEKLEESGLTNNRYTVVGYGGDGIYKTARSLYFNNKLFLNASEMPPVFDHLVFDLPSQSSKSDPSHTSNYTSDAFEALSLASHLSFRPGVSKTFFLFPCIKCDIFSMKLDYSVVHQVLTDSSVTLHIVMNGEFTMSKKRVAKTLFGIDSTLAYTVKDARGLVGDAELRQQVKLPKAQLGFCASLAMETNGTIFASSKLRVSEAGGGRRAATVLATRVSHTSRPCTRAKCECHSTRLRCTACPRHLPRNPMGDISLSMWDSSEMDEFIDNFLDISVPTI